MVVKKKAGSIDAAIKSKLEEAVKIFDPTAPPEIETMTAPQETAEPSNQQAGAQQQLQQQEQAQQHVVVPGGGAGAGAALHQVQLQQTAHNAAEEGPDAAIRRLVAEQFQLPQQPAEVVENQATSTASLTQAGTANITGAAVGAPGTPRTRDLRQQREEFRRNIGFVDNAQIVFELTKYAPLQRWTLKQLLLDYDRLPLPVFAVLL